VTEVFKEIWLSGAHRLRDYKGPCENLHGHNWRVRVYVGATELSPQGMVIDFKVLKDAMKEVIDPYDHAYLNEVAPFDVINPTAENICRHIFQEVDKRIRDSRVRVTRAMVWETEGSCAVVTDPAVFANPTGIELT
jgi:6-pyruvoyltetrahydropterin/6-carboxytetrahydropterin synthase